MTTQPGFHTERLSSPKKGSTARLIGLALIVLAVSLLITAIVFFPNIHFTTVNNRWATTVGKSGPVGHFQSRYDVQIEGTGLVNTWSNLALIGYVVFAASPLGVFVVTAFGLLRQLRRIARGEAYPEVYRPFRRIRGWLAILLGLLPGLIAPGVYMGRLLQSDTLTQFVVSDFEFLRMALVAILLLLIWWTLNYVAAILGIMVVAVLRNTLGVLITAPLMLIFLGLALYVGVAVTLSSIPIEMLEGVTAYTFSRVSILPILLTLIMQLGVSIAANALWQRSWGQHVIRRMTNNHAPA